MHRAIAQRRKYTTEIVGRAAAFAGTLARTIPGAGGALMACFGLGMIYKPLFFIAIGVVLLAVDRRIP